MRACAGVCVCAGVFVGAYARVCVRVCVCAGAYVCASTYVQTRVCGRMCAGACVRTRECGRVCTRVCVCCVRVHVKGLKVPWVLLLPPKRGPVPLLLMPEASLGGLPGFLFFAAAAAASHSACTALSPATRFACAYAASPSAAFFSCCPIIWLKEVCNPKL
jgi:hypothetical protein